MRALSVTTLLMVMAMQTEAQTIRVLDLSADGPGLPVAAALQNLADRVETADSPDLLDQMDVVVIGGGSETAALAQADKLERFVGGGGGVLVAGLPDTLPRTATLWRALGAAAPADVRAADLFPDDSGDWLWIGTQPGETPDHVRYIRHSFTVAKAVRRAFVRCTADNLYTAYLNGEQIGEHWSWYDHELWDIAERLRVGRNVLAFRARNVDGPGGFFAQIGIEYADGTRELITSDRAWKFQTAEEPGWQTLDFDDTDWGPAQDITPMVNYTTIVDRGLEFTGRLTLHGPHPILNGITDRFGEVHRLRGVEARPGARVLISAGDSPVVLYAGYGRGRIVLVDSLVQGDGLATSDLCDDLLAAAILWLGGQTEGLSVGATTYPPATLRRGAGVQLGFALEGLVPAVDGSLRATLTHNGQETEVQRCPLRAGEMSEVRWESEETRDASADGEWRLDLTATDAAGHTIFHRSVVTEVVNPVSVVGNRHVVAKGMTVRFVGDLTGIVDDGRQVRATITDPWDRELAELAGEVTDGTYHWAYEVPDLAEGDYRLVVTVRIGDQIQDSFGATFTVVPRLDLADFFPTTMRLSEFQTLDRPAIEREIDDIIAHGFNTLTFSAHRLGAAPGSPYDYAEDYAQRRGMAVSYSFQGDFSLLQREGLPPVSVFSPEYREALRPRIEAAVETCRQVPRLLNVQGYMDEPFQVSGDTFDDRPPARAEFRRRYGIEMPTREQAMGDPALWLKYVDFWSDCFAADWRQAYEMVKAAYPDFWVELTHDSHCTFGAAGRNFQGFWAVDDVFHWGAPFDAVNYDIYPYLSTDFRTGKFGENRLPRMAGVHMAFAEMRNLAYTYGKKLGFWLESGWGENLAPGAPGRQFPWSPRELTYTAIAAGCDYLNTFWGIPEDPQWWETYRGVMNEVRTVAPLLTRSRVPRAKAAFLFPRTQHVLLQEEYWNVMVALEAFRQAFGELDCIHEEQLAGRSLDGYQVLVLFDIHLLKRADAEVIRDWVRGGGRLVMDEIPSLDENKRPLGVFEPLMSVEGTAEVQQEPISVPEAGVELWGRRSYRDGGEAKLVVSRSWGAGHATLLNFPVKDCYLDALLSQDEGRTARAILDLLRQAATADGINANVFSSNPGIEAALRETPQGTILLLLINHECRDATTRVTLPHVPPGGVVRDMITGERIVAGPSYSMELECPWGETRLLGIFPSDPVGLALEGLGGDHAAGEAVEYRCVLGGEAIRGNYLLQVSVRGPDGREYQTFSGLTCTTDAICQRTIRLPANAQAGRWTVQVRSLWNGAVATGAFEVR